MIIGKVTLHGEALRRELLCDIVHWGQVSADHADSCPVIEVPKSEASTNATAGTSDKDHFSKEESFSPCNMRPLGGLATIQLTLSRALQHTAGLAFKSLSCRLLRFILSQKDMLLVFLNPCV